MCGSLQTGRFKRFSERFPSRRCPPAIILKKKIPTESGCTHCVCVCVYLCVPVCACVCGKLLGTFPAQQRESEIGYKKNRVWFPLKHPAGFDVWLNNTWEKAMPSLYWANYWYHSLISTLCKYKNHTHSHTVQVKRASWHKITQLSVMIWVHLMYFSDKHSDVRFPILFKLMSVFYVFIFLIMK